MPRLAINGFGRIGRQVCRLALSRGVSVIAINDILDPEHLAYLFERDSVHGRVPYPVEVIRKGAGSFLRANGQEIALLCRPDPTQLDWDGVDVVVESTGKFCSLEGGEMHRRAGAKKVILSAPAKGSKVPTFVMGVNHQQYNPQDHHVVSNASCTTNCLAPLAKVLDDAFGIDEGLMTTVHAMTASQHVVDGPSRKAWRDGRASGCNIIPASTGAAKAVGDCLPHLKGKLTGMAFRVPVEDVSVVDLTVRFKKETSYASICDCMRRASETSMKGVLGIEEGEAVSSDFIGDERSAIFDVKSGMQLSGDFYKIVAWYDNESGYASRVIDLAHHMCGE